MSTYENNELHCIEFINIKCQDVDNCSFANWYPKFKSNTFKSKVIPLSDELVNYLNAESIYLPEEGQPIAASIEEIDSDEEITEFLDEQDTNVPHFPQIQQEIKEAIYEFDGAVFPKLNWSSPRDAAWITATQSLKCTSPFDVFLLLKSSDFINHDLIHSHENCIDVEDRDSDTPQQFSLVLRKWYDLQPSMEFRCFVKNQEIIGITQRDLNYYAFLSETREDIEQSIYEFFEDVIRDGFESVNYVFDVYVQHSSSKKVYLVDFNPFSPTTDTLLYDWNELMTFDTEKDTATIRILESQAEANNYTCNAPKFATNMIPKDVVDLSSGKSIAEFAQEFERAMRRAESDEEDVDNSATFTSDSDE